MKQTEFEKLWLASFAPQITKKQYEDCYVNEFLWHVFSYQLVANADVLSGDEAIKATITLIKTVQFTFRSGMMEMMPNLRPFRRSSNGARAF